MAICKVCYGSGLVGQGLNPHLREGRTEVCKACGGTGKVADIGGGSGGGAAPSAKSTGDAGTGGVDNTDEPAPAKRGIISRVFGRKP